MGMARHPQWACRTGDQRSMEGASTRAASCSVEQLGSPVPPPCQRVSFLLPTPGKKMDLEKKEQPYLVGTKAGQMAVELEKLQDSSSGICFLRTVLPVWGVPSPDTSNTSPNIRCFTRKLISVSHNLIILYFQFCQLPRW